MTESNEKQPTSSVPLDKIVMPEDGYDIHLSPCKDCYKRSVAKMGPVRLNGYYCKDLIWDSRGDWSAADGFADAGAQKRGKCPNQYRVKEA